MKPITECSREVTDRILEIRNSPSVRAAMFTDHVISPEEHAIWLQSLVTRDDHLVRVVFHEGKPAGIVVLEKINWKHKTCGWAYYLDESVRGKGIGLATARYALWWAFEECGMEKVNGEALAFNETSWGIDLKIGMKEEGRIRSAYVKDGKRVDVVLVGITRQEWDELQRKAA